MLHYQSTTTFESKKAPGVSYKISKPTLERRMLVGDRTAQAFLELTELQAEFRPIADDIQKAEQAAKLEPCICSHDEERHNKETGRCLEVKCACREPKPDETLGGYKKYSEVLTRILKVRIYKMYPEMIRTCVISIDGLEIDGKNDVESFLSAAPDELVMELGEEVDRMLNLSSAELLGFKSPSTSAGVADGQIQDIPATPASEMNSTVVENVSATTNS